MGILPDNVKKQIRPSTLHNWKKRDLTTYFGNDFVYAFKENEELIKEILRVKQLLNSAKAIYYIYSSYRKMFGFLKNKKRVLKQSREIVVETIDNVKNSIGLNRAVQAFGISQQQFYAWKRNIVCKLNPPDLCRKTLPNQLIPM